MNFENNKIHLPYGDNNSRRMTSALIEELSMFSITESGKFEGVGAHDDLVMALALANAASQVALELFKRGQETASRNGLILVDTKYEMGKDSNGTLTLVDEIHTPDSSRYWIDSEYEERFKTGKNQKMLDKENIRQGLIDRGFSGDGTPPPLTDDIRITLAERYIELYNQLTGKEFIPIVGNVKTRIETNLEKAGIYA